MPIPDNNILSILQQVSSGSRLNKTTFINISFDLLNQLANTDVNTLNDNEFERIKFFHQKVLELINSRSEPLPNYQECSAYKKILDLLELNAIVPMFLARPFKRYFQRVSFAHFIDDAHSNFKNDTKQPTLILDQLAELSFEEVLLQLSTSTRDDDKTLLYDFRQLLMKLSQDFDLRQLTQKQSKKLRELIQKRVRPVIGYDLFLTTQNITVELNPLQEDLTPQQLTLTSNPNQNQGKAANSKFQGLMLSNFHIRHLALEIFIYGCKGQLTFELSYDDEHPFHPDYLFLYQNKLISIAITIQNVYSFQNPDNKDESYQKEISLQVIGQLNNRRHLKLEDPILYYDAEDKSAQFTSGTPVFCLEFYDPLQAFWRQHKPIYIDFKKSYTDSFDDNNFFHNWCEINHEHCKKLSENHNQLVVSTHQRAFYDYFIETLTVYGIYLVCDYSNLDNGKLTYYLYDDLPTEESEQPNKMSYYDLKQVSNIACDVTPPWYQKERFMNLDDAQSQATEVKDIYPEHFLNINSIYTDIITNYDDPKILETTTKHHIDAIEKNLNLYRFSLALNEIMPEAQFYPTYQGIDLDKKSWQSHISNFSTSVILSSQSLSYQRNKATTALVAHEISQIGYNNQGKEDKDRFEKITTIEKNCQESKRTKGITHTCTLTSQWYDKNCQVNFLPQYINFQPFTIKGVIFIGENVDESMRYSYKFFKGQSEIEGCFAEDEQSKREAYCLSDISENAVSYAVSIPQNLLRTEDTKNASTTSENENTKKTIVYVPVPKTMAHSNVFYPLRNQDSVLLKVINSEKIIISALAINTARTAEKASEQLTQRTLYGSEQSFEMSYIQDDKTQTWHLRQKKPQAEGHNHLTLDEKEGITLNFSDEKAQDDQEGDRDSD